MPVTEAFQKQLQQYDEPQLIALLHALQARLGTPHEGTEDVDRAAAVMHQLNNVRTARLLAQDDFAAGASGQPSGA